MKVFEDHWGYMHVLGDRPEAWLKCFQSFGGGYFFLPEDDEITDFHRKYCYPIEELRQLLCEAEEGDAESAKQFLINLGGDLGDEMWMEQEFTLYE